MKKLSSSFFAWLIGQRNSPAMNNQGLAVPAAGGLSRPGYFGVALLIATILFGFSAPVAGQAVNATLLGTVTDLSGATAAGANVTITEMNTGVGGSTTTKESGNNEFPTPPPGGYEVAVKEPGIRHETPRAVGV